MEIMTAVPTSSTTRRGVSDPLLILFLFLFLLLFFFSVLWVRGLVSVFVARKSGFMN